MGKDKRPLWFKMFRHQKALIDSMPDETVGRALKAVFEYFETGEIVELEPLEFAVFSSIKPYIDESYSNYERSVESGRRGGKAKAQKYIDNEYSTP